MRRAIARLVGGVLFVAALVAALCIENSLTEVNTNEVSEVRR